MIVINLKNYKTGKEVVALAKLIRKHLPKAMVAPPALDLQAVAQKTNTKIISQHVSLHTNGRATGHIIPQHVKAIGAKGTLLNHSEHRLPYEEIKKTIKECNRINLKVILCAETVAEAKKFMKLKPYAIAFEDKKLVGSGKSITQYKARDVKTFARLLKRTRIIPLCGAGIATAQDVKAAKELGCEGVLIASAIANTKNPKKLLKELRNL